MLEQHRRGDARHSSIVPPAAYCARVAAAMRKREGPISVETQVKCESPLIPVSPVFLFDETSPGTRVRGARRSFSDADKATKEPVTGKPYQSMPDTPSAARSPLIVDAETGGLSLPIPKPNDKNNQQVVPGLVPASVRA